MNTVCLHVDEYMDAKLMNKIKLGLLQLSNIHNVEVNPNQPHDIMVEYRVAPNLPIDISHQLNKYGLHSYIWCG